MKKLLLTFVSIASIFLANFTQAQDKSAVQTDDFKPLGNFWGYMFSDYYYKTHADSLNRGGGNVQYAGVPAHFGAFQIRRAFLGYDFDMSKTFSTHMVLADESGPSLTTSKTDLTAGSGNNTFCLKLMYLKWADIFKGSDLLFGQMLTPSFCSNSTEQLYGYRSIERTIMDMHAIDNACDFGVSLKGNLWAQQITKDSLMPTFIGYQVLLGNYSSSKPETDKFKKIRGNLFLSTLQQKLVVGLYADFNQTQLNPINVSNTTFKVYADYKMEWMNIGMEAFEQINKNDDNIKTIKNVNGKGGVKDSTYANGVQTGISVFLNGRIIPKKLNYMLRVDMYNPDTKYNKNDTYEVSNTGGNMTTTTFYKQTFYTIGLDYTPMPRVHIMPNLWINQYSAMMDHVAGKALGTKAKNDYDSVARITVYYIFSTSKKVANNGMDN